MPPSSCVLIRGSKQAIFIGVVIYKEKEVLDRFVIELSGYDVYNVSEVKGMEYETVFVIPDGMSDNELYVSYSRALNKLFLLDI